MTNARQLCPVIKVVLSDGKHVIESDLFFSIIDALKWTYSYSAHTTITHGSHIVHKNKINYRENSDQIKLITKYSSEVIYRIILENVLMNCFVAIELNNRLGVQNTREMRDDQELLKYIHNNRGPLVYTKEDPDKQWKVIEFKNETHRVLYMLLTSKHRVYPQTAFSDCDIRVHIKR